MNNIIYHILFYSILILIFYFIVYYFRNNISINNFGFKIQNYLPNVKNYEFISIFRILHSGYLIIMAIQLIELIPFSFFGFESNHNLILFAHYLWIFLSFLILLGTNLRILYIINFLLTTFLLGGNIGDVMLKIASFWMIFIIPVGNVYFKNKILIRDFESNINYGIFYLGLNLSFLISTAGLFKLLGPVWLKGLGFYYAYLQPWIKVDFSEFLLDYDFFIYPMNYLGISFELLAFPFFIFNRTRKISILFMICFLSLVCFPLRIDPVGPAGLIIIVLLLSFYKFKFSKRIISNNTSNTHYTLTFFVTFFVLSQLFLTTFINFKRISYPFVEYPFRLKNEVVIKKSNQNTNNKSNFIEYIQPIGKLISFNYYSIFGFNHSFARGIYNIKSYKDGHEFELIKVFDKDGYVPHNSDRSGIFKPLHLHVVYGDIGIMANKVGKYEINEILNHQDSTLLKSIFNFANVRYKRKYNQNLDSSILFINSIDVPNKYVGLYKSVDDEWNLILKYIYDKNELSIEYIGKSQNFNKIEIDEFKNEEIIFAP